MARSTLRAPPPSLQIVAQNNDDEPTSNDASPPPSPGSKVTTRKHRDMIGDIVEHSIVHERSILLLITLCIGIVMKVIRVIRKRNIVRWTIWICSYCRLITKARSTWIDSQSILTEFIIRAC